MSPNNPGNFVNDLVEMAKAFEALPKVQADLDAANESIGSYAAQVQRLEIKLMDRSNEIAELNSRIRSLEVERDDAQFHSLEADDRTSRALDFIKATFGNAGSLIQALEPAKAVEPQPEPTPTPTEPEGLHTTPPLGQSEPLPSLDAASTPTPWPSVSSATTGDTVSPIADATPSPAPEVAQSHPTSNVYTSDMAEQKNSAETSVTSKDNASISVDHSSAGRYSGKTYSAAKRDAGSMWEWPNQDEWLAGGGTIDNFFA